MSAKEKHSKRNRECISRTYPFWSILEFVLIKSASMNSWVPIVDCFFWIASFTAAWLFYRQGDKPEAIIFTDIHYDLPLDVPLELTWLQVKIKLAVHKGKLNICRVRKKNCILGWTPAIDCVMFRQEMYYWSIIMACYATDRSNRIRCYVSRSSRKGF